MYAIVEQAGFQYRVKEGDIIDVPNMDRKSGDKVKFDKVLMISDGEKINIGTPVLAKAEVNAEVVHEDRKKKVIVFKYKKKKSYALMKGHRQDYTRLKITGISL